MKIRTRLSLVFGVILMLTTAVGYAGCQGVTAITDTTLELLRTEAKVAELAARAWSDALGLRRFEKDVFLIVENQAKVEEYIGKWRAEHDELTATLASIEPLVQAAEDREDLATMRAGLARYDEGFAGVLAQINAGIITTPAGANAAIGTYKDAIRDFAETAEAFEIRPPRLHAQP